MHISYTLLFFIEYHALQKFFLKIPPVKNGNFNESRRNGRNETTFNGEHLEATGFKSTKHLGCLLVAVSFYDSSKRKTTGQWMHIAQSLP